MDDRICLDTDIIINFLRNKKEEVEFIRQHENVVIFATTTINIFELYYDAYKSGRQENIDQVEQLQHRIKILNLSNEAVEQAGCIVAQLEKNGNPVDFRDVLIGCIAKTEFFCIKTNNKHFERIPLLKVV